MSDVVNDMEPPPVDPDRCNCGHHRDSHYLRIGPCKVVSDSEYNRSFGEGMCLCRDFRSIADAEGLTDDA